GRGQEGAAPPPGPRERGGPPPGEGAAGPPQPEPAERLRRLWREGRHPHVDAFLAEAGPLPPAQVAAVLRVDQRQRWAAGERVGAEEYLNRHPGVAADADAALDLIFNEYLLREQLGEQPGPEEYQRRFPQHEAALGEQIRF